jgi:diguanylate cyclase (GGDEF)-like protein
VSVEEDAPAVTDDLERAAHRSGMRAGVLPSLEQVERRRFELWLVSTGLLIALTAALGILSLWPAEDIHDLLARPEVRYGMFGLAVIVSAYSVEKEMSLRRVSRLLVDERMLTTALSSRLHEITTLLDAGRAVNSTLELDRVLSSILSGATDLLPATHGRVLLLEDGKLELAAEAGTHEGDVDLADAVVQRVVETHQPLRVSQHSTSSLCVPLIERGRLVGVLNLIAASEGQFSDYDLRAVSLFAEQAAAAIGKARLYEQSRVQAEQLSYAATHDALTDLSNRAALSQRAAQRNHETLLFLDLDGFKEVNDEFGHQIGDELLVAIGRRLVRCVSGRDLVCRYGGDEFAILLDGSVDAATASRIAARIVSELHKPVGIGGHEVLVTVSVGIAVPAPGGSDLDVLMQQADRALYEAKATGKARSCVYSPSLSAVKPRAESDDQQSSTQRAAGV